MELFAGVPDLLLKGFCAYVTDMCGENHVIAVNEGIAVEGRFKGVRIRKYDMEKQIVVYEGMDDVRLEVKTDGETVWLTQAQMCQLFGRDRTVITKHINNIFKEGELERELVCAKFAHTTIHGAVKGRSQVQEVTAYNLDVVISVGYRVKSIQGTRFRQWATRLLREMLLNRLDEIKRIAQLERRMDAAEGDIKQIKGGMNYLVQQLSAPPDPPRKRIGFNNGGSPSTKPYGKK